MKTLAEIINFIENLKNKYNEQLNATMWHINLNIGSDHTEITFFKDIKKETKELRTEIKNELGEPIDIKFWENTEYDDNVTYRYNLE